MSSFAKTSSLSNYRQITRIFLKANNSLSPLGDRDQVGIPYFFCLSSKLFKDHLLPQRSGSWRMGSTNTQEAITLAQNQAFSMGLPVSNHGLNQNVWPPPSPQEARELSMAWGASKTQKIELSFLSVKMIFPAGCSGAHIGTQR